MTVRDRKGNARSLGHKGWSAGDRRRVVDVEELARWTYQDQRAHVVVGRGVGLHRIEAAVDGVKWQSISLDGVAALERVKALGMRPESGGMASGVLHPDAELVHGIVTEIGREDPLSAQLVVDHAARDARPDWCPRGPRLGPVLRPGGRGPQRIYDRNRHWIGCDVTWIDSPATVEMARHLYAAWWLGLVMLTGRLMAKGAAALVAHQVIGPLAPRRPWEATGY